MNALRVVLALFVDDFCFSIFALVLVLRVSLVTLLLDMSDREKTCQVLHKQAREIVFYAYQFFKRGVESVRNWSLFQCYQIPLLLLLYALLILLLSGVYICLTDSCVVLFFTYSE